MALGSQLNQTVDNPFYGIINSGALVDPEDQPRPTAAALPAVHRRHPAVLHGRSSNYHALQVSFSRRFSHGFQFEGSYTWAKAIQEGLSHP